MREKLNLSGTDMIYFYSMYENKKILHETARTRADKLDETE